MTKLILSVAEEQFEKECLALSVESEYPGYIGDEKWIIITDLTDEELTARYESLLLAYSPYIKLSKKQGEPIITYNRNEEKHKKRRKLYESLLPNCDTEDEIYSQLTQEDFASKLVMNDYIKGLLDLLPSDIQRRRITMHYLQGYSAVEIAKMENVSSQAVNKSLHYGINYLKKILI